MKKVENYRTKPEYPPRQPKNNSLYGRWGLRRWEDSDSDRFISYWYPMSRQAAGYDDDPDYQSDYPL